MLMKTKFVKTLLKAQCYNLIKKYSTTICKDPKIRYFSGIQPTGSLHIGNYLGAVKQWVKYQEANECVILSIVDLHSITLPQDPVKLSHSIMEMMATLIACGIDPGKVLLFQQSQVHQHTELCWILGCISTMARLAHLPQFKEKSANLKDVPLGLYIYPVLQAADILLYKGTHVPVGDDQLQHLQLTQDLCRMFNNRYGETFPMPHSIINSVGTAKIRSLRDPAKKMSKSDPDPKNRINLTDSDSEIQGKIKKAVTDFTSEVTFDLDKRPGVSNLITIHSELSGKSIEEIVKDAEGLNTGQYKAAVADAVIKHVAPIRENIFSLMNESGYIMELLDRGSAEARELAEEMMQVVRRKVGFCGQVNSAVMKNVLQK